MRNVKEHDPEKLQTFRIRLCATSKCMIREIMHRP
jgi:hypothetical protein